MAATKTEECELVKRKSPVLFTIRKLEITRKQAKWGIFSLLVGISLIALVAVIIYTEVYISSFDIRVDCNPDLPLNYNKCLQRGCIWVQRSGEEPPCFFPHGYGYKYTDIRNTSNGYHVNLKREPPQTIFGKEVNSVSLMVFVETEKRIRLKFVDSNQKRYEVPLDVPPPPAEAAKNVEYKIEFTNDPQFGVLVKRISTGKILLDTNVPGMVFSNQFLQITTKLASSYIYGLGERLSSEYKHDVNWKKRTLFSRDVAPTGDWNLYGVHPFYINLELDGNAHGVFLLNSNAMEYVLQPYPALTFRTIGGILDFYVFMGPTPEDVVKQYLEVVGLPAMPPYWGLGFQLSRYGYRDINDVETVVNRTISSGIPYDVQHFDIDYMEDFRDFTVNKTAFGHLDKFVSELHQKGIRVIIILDPGIASNKTLRENYLPLEMGEKRNVFIKINGSDLEAECWPGKVRFPDFSLPETKDYWTQMCTEFRKSIKFDGIWIDMNEPASFADGSLTGCSSSSLNFPPYAANVLGSKKDGRLFEKTICMDAEQHAGKHYDVHSLYGYFQANATFRTLSIIIPGNRPMILSRSTYSGSGRFASHWLGDNHSTWSQMRASIPGILDFNIFGIPHVGADICGFSLDVTEELCLRWMQLGAFYPFSRNHNGFGSKDQDPASLGESVIKASRDALNSRYTLLPYLYTLFYLAHTKGSTVARPLLHEFPTDKKTWSINYQFLWGQALLISPIVHEGKKEVDAYFPEGIWYDFHSGKIVKEGKGQTLTLPDESRVNLHVRGGFILPLQNPAVTVVKSRNESMGLFIAPNDKGMANGILFWDDGASSGSLEHKAYLLLEFSYEQNSTMGTLSSNVKVNGYPDASILNFDNFIFCNQKAPKRVVLNDSPAETMDWKYAKDILVITMESSSIPIAEKFNLSIHY